MKLIASALITVGVLYMAHSGGLKLVPDSGDFGRVHWAAIAVYVHTAIYGSAAVSAFWSLVNERFDPHSAKKIVGRIASGGTIGGVVGGVVVWRASAHLSVPMMLALLAGINVFGLFGALRTVGRASDTGGAVGSPAGKTTEPLAGGGWKIVRETPYLCSRARSSTRSSTGS